MRSKFSILGHPLHPIMIVLPAGLIIWTFAADIIYLITGKDEEWYDISFWTGGAAVVTALAAALPGFGDYLTLALKSRAMVQATAHMLLNLTIVALFAAAFIIGWDDGATSGTNLAIVVVLHGIGVGLLTAAGYLGGQLAHRHHLSVIPHDAEDERREMDYHGS